MKLILLSHTPIKAKDGREFNKFTAISEKGKIVEPFMDRNTYNTLGFAEAECLSESDVKDLFENYKSVDISFDATGRVEALKK